MLANRFALWVLLILQLSGPKNGLGIASCSMKMDSRALRGLGTHRTGGCRQHSRAPSRRTCAAWSIPGGGQVGPVVCSWRLSALRLESGCHLPGILRPHSLGAFLAPVPAPFSSKSSLPLLQREPTSCNHGENRLFYNMRREGETVPSSLGSETQGLV